MLAAVGVLNPNVSELTLIRMEAGRTFTTKSNFRSELPLDDEDVEVSGALAVTVAVEERFFVPAAGAVLADWGADVIKVEHPEMGDPQRGLIAMGLIPGGDSAVNEG